MKTYLWKLVTCHILITKTLPWLSLALLHRFSDRWYISIVISHSISIPSVPWERSEYSSSCVAEPRACVWKKCGQVCLYQILTPSVFDFVCLHVVHLPKFPVHTSFNGRVYLRRNPDAPLNDRIVVDACVAAIGQTVTCTHNQSNRTLIEKSLSSEKKNACKNNYSISTFKRLYSVNILNPFLTSRCFIPVLTVT